jgi:hypothetical protein
MNQIMHIVAEQFVNTFIAQSAEAGRVAERAAAFEVNSKDSLGGRVEKQSEFVFALVQCLLRMLLLGDVSSHGKDARLTVQFDHFQ